MVRRNEIGVLQQVTNVVADTSSDAPVYEALSNVAFSVAEQAAKIKSAQTLASAKGQLRQLRNDIFTAQADDPAAAAANYKTARGQLIEQALQQVPPALQYRIRADFQTLSNSDDVGVDEWSFRQNQTNMVNGLRSVVEQSVNGAYEEGAAFADQDGAIAFPAASLIESQNLVYNSAVGVQGEASAQKLLQGFRGDYLKSFLSGVGERNPAKALTLLEDKAVASQLAPDDRRKLKEAFEGRAVNIVEAAADREIVGFVARNAEALSGQPMPFVQLQDLMQRQGMSELAQRAFLKANGYSVKGQDSRLTPVEKAKVKDGLTMEMIRFLGQDDRTIEDFRGIQMKVAEAVAQGAITTEQARKFNDQYIVPFAETVTEAMDSFKGGALKGTVLADTKELDAFYDDQIQRKERLWGLFESDMFDDVKGGKQLRAASRVRLYEPYIKALEQAATSRRTTVGGLATLDSETRRVIHEEATQYAKAEYLKSLGVQPQKGVSLDIQIDQATTKVFRDAARQKIDNAIDQPADNEALEYLRRAAGKQ